MTQRFLFLFQREYYNKKINLYIFFDQTNVSMGSEQH